MKVKLKVISFIITILTSLFYMSACDEGLPVFNPPTTESKYYEFDKDQHFGDFVTDGGAVAHTIGFGKRLHKPGNFFPLIRCDPTLWACTCCHGENLRGGQPYIDPMDNKTKVPPSCYTCHTPRWW